MSDVDVTQLQYWLGMAGTVAFAATAVSAVAPRGVDFFGALVLGIITAIGGGTVRDLILNVDVFWAYDLNYIWVAMGATLTAFVANRLMTRWQIYRVMLYLDGLGAAMFAIQATHKVMRLEFGMPLGPIILGVTTAIGGGLIRDTLAGNPTLLMRHEIYAIPIAFGCIIYYALMTYFPAEPAINAASCTFLIFAFRAIVIHRNLTLPSWLLTQVSTEEKK